MEPQFIPHSPTGILSGVVENLFYLGGYTPEHSRERLVPDPYVSLIIELDGRERPVYDNRSLETVQICRLAWVSALRLKHLIFHVPPDTELMAVRLLAGTAYPLLRRDLATLNDRVVPAVEIFGDAILGLRHRLLHEASPADRLALFHHWLQQHYDPALAPPAEFLELVRAIQQRPTLDSVREVLDASPRSHRQVLRLFRRHVGLTPKKFQRMLRFGQVIPAVQAREQVDWAELASECGYYDQAHLIRDFAAFSGHTPEQFRQAGYEGVNFFPD